VRFNLSSETKNNYEITDCVWLAIPQATEWQRIGSQIDAALIFTRVNFVDVCFATLARNSKRRWKSLDLFSLLFSLGYFFSQFLLNLPMKRGGGGNRTRE
jgi:hypothetical protein